MFVMIIKYKGQKVEIEYSGYGDTLVVESGVNLTTELDLTDEELDAITELYADIINNNIRNMQAEDAYDAWRERD